MSGRARPVLVGLTVASTLVLLAACAGRRAETDVTPASTTPSGSPRVVVMALDAVPFDTVVELLASDPELFAGFGAPSALISTFPSSTSLAMTGILEPFGLEPAQGYEARFFDRGRNRVRGGGMFSYNTLKFSWRKFWHWHAGTLRKLTSGARPVRASVSAIEDSLEAFMRSDETVFVAYNDATDLVGHLRSPEALKPVLRRLDTALRELRRRHPRQPFHTVLFSDHGLAGGAPLRNVRRPVRRALAGAGYRIAKRIRERRDVVLVPFGLLSSIVAYSADDTAPALAETLGAVDGVDFCVAPTASDGDFDAWHFSGDGGRAALHRRQEKAAAGAGKVEWRYLRLDPGAGAEGGDPLGLRPPDEAWHGDRWWFDATAEGAYPDPFHRVARAFDLVTNPASVVCSLAPGWMYGALATNSASRLTVGRLRWTHGAMGRDESLGFVMSDLPGWSPAPIVRFDRALAPVVAYATAAGGR